MMWVLAQELNDDTVSPGLTGGLMVLGLIIAMVFLMRSMSKRIRNVDAPHQADLDQQAWEEAESAKNAEEHA